MNYQDVKDFLLLNAMRFIKFQCAVQNFENTLFFEMHFQRFC